MPCKMCLNRKQDWTGDKPKCYFDNPSNNWNCATVNAIRDICYEGQQQIPKGVDYQYCGDRKYATICLDEIGYGDSPIGLALWVSWYKSRGRTDAMWILDECDTPRSPSEGELLAIIEHYENQGA